MTLTLELVKLLDKVIPHKSYKYSTTHSCTSSTSDERTDGMKKKKAPTTQGSCSKRLCSYESGVQAWTSQ